MTNSEYDVIIVGAGIAGLMAAKKILEKKAVEANKILFVEALDRIGGRLLKLTQDVDRTPNNPVDVGACWICPEQPMVYELAQELGLTIMAQEDRGLRVHLESQGGFGGWIQRAFGLTKKETEEKRCSLKQLPLLDALAYVNLGKKFEKMANELIQDSEKPWEATDAEKWDTMTCEDYLQAEVKNVAARGLMRSALVAIFCLPTTEYSMLWFLANLKAEGSFDMFTVGAQSHRVKEGNGSYPNIIGKELEDAGVKTMLSTKLTSVKEDENGVSLSTSGGDFYCKHAIVTLPPTERQKVKFEPELPQSKYDAEMKMGKCIKTVLAYKERWWDGSFAFADPSIDGVHISLVADVSHDYDGKECKEPMLATFYYGTSADQYTGDSKKEERKAEAIRGAQNLLCDDPLNPDPRSTDVLSVVEGDWPSTPYIYGAYACVANVGAITKTKMFHRDLQKACGKVHFAGTELAERWAGYMEGAIMTGRKAGEEVAEALLNA